MLGEGPAALAAIVASVIVGAFVQGCVGFGLGLIVIPVLALVAPERLPHLALLIGLPTIILVGWRERHSVQQAELAWLLIGRLGGTVVGAAVVAVISTVALQLLCACSVLLAVIGSVLGRRSLPINPTTKLTAGSLSGFFGTSTGLGGPPIALLYAGMSGPHLRATLSAALLVGNIISLGALGLAGRIAIEDLGFAALLIVPVVLGLRLSGPAIRVIDHHRMRTAVLVASGASAVAIVAQVAVRVG